MKLMQRFIAAARSFRRPITNGSAVHWEPKFPKVVYDNELLSGKNVLITGSGRNIGKSIATEMACQGANIFFTEIDEQRARALEQQLKKDGKSVKYFLSDVSKTQDSDLLLRHLTDSGIQIDVLVNNVGVQHQARTIQAFDPKEWAETYQTNIFGPLYLTRLISQRMIERQSGGSILFLTSVHQWMVIGSAAYSSSKAALGMIIRELALELAAYHIRVNGIAPGWVVEDELGKPLPSKNQSLWNTSINPDFIGRAAVYLASDYFSKFTTGTVIKIDAGLSLFNPHSRA